MLLVAVSLTTSGAKFANFLFRCIGRKGLLEVGTMAWRLEHYI